MLCVRAFRMYTFKYNTYTSFGVINIVIAVAMDIAKSNRVQQVSLLVNNNNNTTVLLYVAYYIKKRWERMEMKGEEQKEASTISLHS